MFSFIASALQHTWILFFVCFGFTHCCLSADDQKNITSEKILAFIDQHGEPVSNVVVTLPILGSLQTSVTPIMDQIDKQFIPKVLLVKQGQSVSFPNSDDIRHHVYSFSKPKTFEIRLFKGSNNEPIIFDKPGIVVLGCNIHDNMRGFIYVANKQWTSISGVDGMIAIPSEINEFQAWHPGLSPNHTRRITINLNRTAIKNTANHQLTLDLIPLEKKIKKRKFKSRFNRESD